MNPDSLKHVWQSQMDQTRLLIDTELLLKEVRQNQRFFTAILFWRDFREVGFALLMVPVWIYIGVMNSSPWTWYLTVPSLIGIAGFILMDRIRHNRKPPEPSEQIRPLLESSLAQVQHQIWLLRNVHWWYLLPLSISILAFFGQTAWQDREGGLLTVLGLSMVVAIGAIVFATVYWLNQHSVRTELIPRSRELESLLLKLEEESPDAK